MSLVQVSSKILCKNVSIIVCHVYENYLHKSIHNALLHESTFDVDVLSPFIHSNVV